MPRCLPVLAALLCIAASTEEATAQLHSRATVVTASARTGATGVVGVVTDEGGAGVSGASILAMGASLAIVRTDVHGRFTLDLPPGPYILRATRDGYISTYREAVHVGAEGPLTRVITLLQVDDTPGIVLASTRQPIVAAPGEEASVPEAPRPTPMAPGDMAWRLRHLPRTALRDRSGAVAWDDEEQGWRTPVRASLLADLNGRVDLLTVGAVPASGALSSERWPQSVAYMVLGAPIGGSGDWSVRASFGGGEKTAWTAAGEYALRTDSGHTFHAGVAYAEQTLGARSMRHSLAVIDSVRSVGGLHVSDSWILPGGFRVDSALRVERYEYLAEPMLLGGRLGISQQVGSRLTFVVAAAPHMVAPGADQFAPPTTSGVWLPAERTFSALEPGRALEAQRIASYEGGADAVLHRTADGTADLTLRLRGFRERSSTQLATLFGLDAASQVGHYYIGSPGDVDLDGWSLGLAGTLAPGIEASIDYAATAAAWHPSVSRIALRRAVRSAARRGHERLHDVMATLDARVPMTDTRVNLALRVNSGFSPPFATVPGVGVRYAVEVRQLLPVRVLDRAEFNLLLSARTLVHDLDEGGGFYDELLTVAPPVRLTGGLQMRF